MKIFIIQRIFERRIIKTKGRGNAFSSSSERERERERERGGLKESNKSGPGANFFKICTLCIVLHCTVCVCVCVCMRAYVRVCA